MNPILPPAVRAAEDLEDGGRIDLRRRVGSCDIPGTSFENGDTSATITKRGVNFFKPFVHCINGSRGTSAANSSSSNALPTEHDSEKRYRLKTILMLSSHSVLVNQGNGDPGAESTNTGSSEVAPNIQHSIFRVPAKLRKLNDNAYTPQSVSIGPLHYGKAELKGMEECKGRFLEAFLRRTTMSKQGWLGLIGKWEVEVRSCYVETITLMSDEFVKMVLVDGGFIIESMLRYWYDKKEQGIFHYVRMDLILVENQLPFFLLDRLFDLAFPYPGPIEPPSMLKLSISYIKEVSVSYIKEVSPTHEPPYQGLLSSKVKHLVDLMRIIQVPSSTQRDGGKSYVRVQTASELKEAGMTFKDGSSQFVTEMTYDSGVVEIPRFSVDNCTELVLRNMIALEVYFYRCNSFILDYVYFMDALIDSAKDVDILVDSGIMNNYIGDSEAVANMFNGLTTHTWLEVEHYYFSQLSKDLNSYCKVRYHTWKAILRRDYFSSPIKGASVTAATILLVLTFIQTVSSAIPLSKEDTYLMLGVIALPVAAIVAAFIATIFYSHFGCPG